MTKHDLRQLMKSKRAELSPAEIAARSARIQDKLLELPEVIAARSLFVYVSYRSEVGTHPLIRHCLGEGKTVVVPKTLGPTQMEAHPLTEWSQLRPGLFGILAPEGTLSYDGRLDVCIAPGLASPLTSP